MNFFEFSLAFGEICGILLKLEFCAKGSLALDLPKKGNRVPDL